jgi:hypothetical protein
MCCLFWGKRAMIPRFSTIKSRFVEKHVFGRTSIKSKAVWSCRNQLRVLLQMQCITFYSCIAIQHYTDPTLTRLVDSLLLKIKHGNLYEIILVYQTSWFVLHSERRG